MATIIGTIGDDDLTGTSGDDFIYGYDQSNQAATDGGNDRLIGGAGAFAYTSFADSLVPSRDFQQGVDHIDLAAIDASLVTPDDQAFTFIGASAFTHAAAQLRAGSDGAGNTIVDGDVQGDGVADFQILLKGAYALNGSDFIL